MNRGIFIYHSEVLVITEIIKDSKNKKTYRMGNRETNIIRYADETMLITDQFVLSAQKYDTKMLISKTQISSSCDYLLYVNWR